MSFIITTSICVNSFMRYKVNGTSGYSFIKYKYILK
jgi:hypothetical protein